MPNEQMTIDPKRGYVPRPALYLPPESGEAPPGFLLAFILGIVAFGALSANAWLIIRAVAEFAR